MTMQTATTSATAARNLELKKRIDAICDRFEQAWAHDPRPRIEDFLAEVAADHRPLLFRELLALEVSLALQPLSDETRDDYAKRFPQYQSVINDVCVLPDATILLASPHDTWVEQFLAIVEAFRSQRAADSRFSSGDRIQKLRDVLGQYDPTKTPAAILDCELAIWLWICHVAFQAGFMNPQGVASLVDDLLSAFSDLRRSLLLSVLVGGDIDRAATVNQVSQRTVRATIAAAIELLSCRPPMRQRP